MIHFKNGFKVNSTIMDAVQKKQLADLGEFPKEKSWILKYQASKDEFNSKDFHSKCNRIENTLTVVKSTNRNVFVGYTDKMWHSNGASVTECDPKSFNFSLINL